MIIIGERVNASRKAVRQAILSHDEAAIRQEIIRQDEAGAHYIDLNAGTGAGDTDRESADLRWLVDCALACTEKKLALDSADPEVLRAAAGHLGGRRPWMLNSIKDDPDAMEQGLSLAREHQAPLIALAMDKDGIPPEADRRLNICAKIYAKAREAGIPPARLYFDPLALPVSADISQGKVTFETLGGLRDRFPEAKTTMGLSNASYGLKKRSHVNAAFLLMAMARGLDSAICDPLRPQIAQALLLGQLLLGRDRYCRRFNRAARQGIFDNEKK